MLERIHALKDLAARRAKKRVIAKAGGRKQGTTSIPASLHSLATLHAARPTWTYLVQGQQGVALEEAMEITKEDEDRDILHIRRVAVEVRDELNGLGEQKPKEQGHEGGGGFDIGQLGRSRGEGTIEKVNQKPVVDQCRRMECGQVKCIRRPGLLATLVSR